MAPADEVEVESFYKCVEVIFAENLSATSLIFIPVGNVFTWVVPEELRDNHVVRYFSRLLNIFDVLEALDILGDATVHTQDAGVDQGCQRYMVKAVNKLGPKRNFVSPLDLIEEAILLCDCFTFVVAPQQDNLTRIPHFESE